MGLEQLHLLRLSRIGAVEVTAQHRVEHQLYRLLRAPVEVHRFLRRSSRLLLELLRRRGRPNRSMSVFFGTATPCSSRFFTRAFLTFNPADSRFFAVRVAVDVRGMTRMRSVTKPALTFLRLVGSAKTTWHPWRGAPAWSPPGMV